MSDLLVKLYELKDDSHFMAEMEKKGVLIRKPMGPEKALVVNWVREQFGEGWASETDTALGNRPGSCFIAITGEQLVGFGCYDATYLGFFGPTGVAESQRGRGVGKALLLACLFDMKSKGYAYAVIGSAGPVDFYAKTVGATIIPNSDPGPYRTMLA